VSPCSDSPSGDEHEHRPRLSGSGVRNWIDADQVAAAAAISKPYLSNIETGKANTPSDGMLTKLERVLQIESGTLMSMAHLEKTPSDVRQKQEQLATEVERLRGVLSGLYTKMSAMPKGEASVNLDELAAQMLPEGNVKPLSLGRAIRSSTRWRRDIRTSSPTWTIRPGGRRVRAVRGTWTIRRPSPPASWATRWSRPTARATWWSSPQQTPSSGADCFVRFAADCSTTFKRYFQDDENTIRLQPLE